MQLDVRVPMHDGVELSVDIYRPEATGTFPAVLNRTPYSNNIDPLITSARRLASQGYVCVLQDCRGRWDSDGAYYPFREGPDGYVYAALSIFEPDADATNLAIMKLVDEKLDDGDLSTGDVYYAMVGSQFRFHYIFDRP